MKRFLWLMCLCGSIGALAACGDDGTTKKTGDAGTEDGGGSGNQVGTGGSAAVDTKALDAVQKEADATKKTTDTLTKQVMDLQTALDMANKNVSSVTGDVNKLKNPEAPAPLDGIALAQMGILDLVEKACGFETMCCDSDEMTYRYGPTITTSKECVDTFSDLVAKGITPSYLQTRVPVLQYIVNIAQALASSELKVELDKTGIKACEDWLDAAKCDQYVAPQTGTTVHCAPFEEVVANPCDVETLLTGKADKGEVCGTVYGIGGCKPGLICQSQGPSGGVCADPVGAGSRCLSDGDCQHDLFCNLSKGECQARGDVGDDCAFIDPTFTASSGRPNPPPSIDSEQNALAIKCKLGLQCDPTSTKCIKSCGEDTLCQPGSATPYLTCPDGMVCNVTVVPELYQHVNLPGTTNYGFGVCRAPGAAGDACTLTLSSIAPGSECESKNCKQNSGGDTTCGDPLKHAGDDCQAGGGGVSSPDDTCESEFCGTDGKCVKPCTVTTTNSGTTYICDSGFYCNSQQQITGGSTFTYACEPLVDNTSPCGFGVTVARDATCSSGYCENNTQCAAKVAAGQPCPTGRAEQCPAAQYCDPNGGTPTCMAVLAPATDCNGKAAGACGPGNHCFTSVSQTPNAQCVVPGGSGDTCNPSDGQGTCAPTLNCVTPVNKCYLSGKYPTDTPCVNDQQCDSGWCGDAGANKKCMTPIAIDSDCDSDAAKNVGRCAKGAFCKHDTSSSSGKCVAQQTTGQACEPRYAGMDCLNYTNDSSICGNGHGVFVCDPRSVADMTVICDGN